MTTPDSAPADPPRSTFQVTHFMRPAAGGGWSQSQSGELAAGDAVAFIGKQAVEALDLGFADGPAETPVDPTVTPAAAVTSPVSDGTTAADVAEPSLGDS